MSATLAPASAPETPALHPTPGFLLFLASMTSLEFLQTGMINFAARPLIAGVHGSPQGFSLAATIYSVAAIAMLLQHRWLAERLGYRRFTLLSLALFGTGALLCAEAGSIEMFWAGRLLQGAGGATFFCAGRIICNSVRAESRPRALIAFIIALMGSASLAPLLSAWSITHASWRAIFWGMLPLVMIVALLASRHMPKDVEGRRDGKEPFQWKIMIGLVLGVGAIQFAIQRVRFDLFSHPLPIVAMAIIGLLAVLWFSNHQQRRPTPLIDYRQLAHARFLVGMLCYGFGYVVMNANGYLMPHLLQQALGMCVLVSGYLLALASLGSLGGEFVLIRMMPRRQGHKIYMMAGLVLLILYGLLSAGFSSQTPWELLALNALTGGIFMSFFMGPVARGAFQNMDARTFSHAYQTKNIIREIAGSTGITLATLFLQLRSSAHYQQLATDDRPNMFAHSDGLLTSTLQPLLHGTEMQAMLLACADYHHALTITALLVLLLVWRQKVYG